MVMRRRQQPPAAKLFVDDLESLIDIKDDPTIVTSRNYNFNGSSLTTEKSQSRPARTQFIGDSIMMGNL